MSGVILVFSVAIWFLGYFPNHNAYDTVKEQQEHSYIGYIGKAMEPVLEPLGFDWRMGVGIVAGVGAKELVVSTLGVMYAPEEPVRLEGDLQTGSDDCYVGDDIGTGECNVVSDGNPVSESAGETRLQKALQRSITPAAALAYMVFILLYFPCIATFIAIRRESGSWKWAILTAVYTIILAWIAAFITFRIAMLFGL